MLHLVRTLARHFRSTFTEMEAAIFAQERKSQNPRGFQKRNVSTQKGRRRSFLVRTEDELGRRALLAKRACERPDGSRPRNWLLKIVIQEFPNAKTDPRLLVREKSRV